MDKGVFIAIEGVDGSGKETQFKLLRERLRAVGHEVEIFDFPDYARETSYFVKQYLDGKYGKTESISPYAASLFYALDRYDAANKIRKALKQGKVVLANCYVGSNMAHQGAKFEDPIEQRSFFVWEDSLEYQLLDIPRPNINLFLRVDAKTSQKLINQRVSGDHVSKDHDLDITSQRRTIETFEKLCQLFPKDFTLIDCVVNDKLLSIPEVNNKLWAVIKPMLPTKPSRPPQSVTFSLGGTKDPVTPQKEKPLEQSSAAIDLGDVSLASVFELSLKSHLELIYKFSWEKNGYDYLMPKGLPPKTAAKYEEIMEQLADQHKIMRDKLGKAANKDELLRPAMPLAALLRLEIKTDPEEIKQAIEALSGLSGQDDKEATEKLSGQAHKHWPAIFAKGSPAVSSQPESVKDIIDKLVNEHLPQTLGQHTETVELTEATPRNEFKILTDIIYTYSSLPRDQLQQQVDKLSYQQKVEALQAGLKAKVNSFADKLIYRFDVTIDRLALNELAASQVASEINSQPATPRYGYDVPEQIDSRGIADEYLACFDKSLELFSTLQASGNEELAVYATLAGHKNRYQIECSLQSLLAATATSSVVKEMINKISEVHPIIGEYLKSGTPTQAPKTKRSRRGRRHRSTKKSR